MSAERRGVHISSGSCWPDPTSVAGTSFKAKSFWFQDNITTAVLSPESLELKSKHRCQLVTGWLAFFIFNLKGRRILALFNVEGTRFSMRSTLGVAARITLEGLTLHC